MCILLKEKDSYKMSLPNKTQDKINTLKIVLDDLINAGEEITIPRVCELAGCSRSFLYQNEEAKTLLENAKNKPTPTTPPDILLQYEELKRKLQDSYILQYQLLSAENERLKTQLADLEQKINDFKSKK